LRLDRIPVMLISHLNDLENLALADNRIALDTGWDRETLPLS
jgi:hypothetical protein